MAKLVVPDQIVLRLVDAQQECIRLPDVLFRIHIRANRKNDFLLAPFSTDGEGVASIFKREIEAEVAASYDAGLMDYIPFEECQQLVTISLLTPIDIERALDSRTRVWTALLRGESERWRSIEDLIEVYRKAVNERVSAAPVQQSWDGAASKRVSFVIAEVR